MYGSLQGCFSALRQILKARVVLCGGMVVLTMGMGLAMALGTRRV